MRPDETGAYRLVFLIETPTLEGDRAADLREAHVKAGNWASPVPQFIKRILSVSEISRQLTGPVSIVVF